MFDDGSWHWLEWNFGMLQRASVETPFARLTLDALLRCDGAMAGFAAEMLDRVAAIGGREKDQDDYQAILQWLAELVVIHHFVTWHWPAPTTFEHEPSTQKGGSNPEFIVTCADTRLGVEVKCPDLRRHVRARSTNDWQMLARFDQSMVPSGDAPITLPRDNPMKDFLHSCESKFAQFRDDAEFRSVLVVLWDDQINEPVSALLSPMSGLFTDQSFDRVDGQPHRHPSTDAVVLLRHQHQLIRGTQNKPATDDRSDFLDCGTLGRFPHNALVVNPDGKNLTPLAQDVLQAVEPDPRLGAEYSPAEVVMWVG